MWYDKFKQEQTLVETSEGHNKFWAAAVDGQTNQATIRWGRLGTKGQSLVKDFDTVAAAARFVDDKMREKRRKGYQTISRSSFDRLCVEAAIVGAQNKCGALQWVEITDPDKITYVACDESRLQDPSCNPGIKVEVNTKKEYGGRNHFEIIFTFDKSYDLFDKSTITKGNPIYELTSKVEEAIGRSLSV